MLSKRKKLEIFVEPHALSEVEGMLTRTGFKGWSVFPGQEGAGAHGAWRQTGVEEGGVSLVIAIGAEDSSQAALAWLESFFGVYPGIVAVSDVEVMRAERF